MENNAARFFYLIGSSIMIVWILFVGQSILLPIILGILTVYILLTASEAIAKWPMMNYFSKFIHRLVVLLIFVSIVALISFMISNNIEYTLSQLPIYQANLQIVVDNLAEGFGLSNAPSLNKIIENWWRGVDLQSFAFKAFGSISSVGSILFMTALYAGFLLTEVNNFNAKISKALGGDATQALEIISKVNNRIGVYLTIKTIINIILASISFLIMWVMGIDSAVFWAVMIGFLNYIPYVGSAIGVGFPVGLALAQFGSLQWSLLALVLLMAVQTYVGNILEPKMIGKSVNLSSFVVLLALVFWTTIWGLPGAILSIPLTSVLVILLAENQSTKPFAAMFTSDGDL